MNTPEIVEKMGKILNQIRNTSMRVGKILERRTKIFLNPLDRGLNQQYKRRLQPYKTACRRLEKYN